jgi:hypothetical protein
MQPFSLLRFLLKLDLILEHFNILEQCLTLALNPSKPQIVFFLINSTCMTATRRGRTTLLSKDVLSLGKLTKELRLVLTVAEK